MQEIEEFLDYNNYMIAITPKQQSYFDIVHLFPHAFASGNAHAASGYWPIGQYALAKRIVTI